MRTQLAQPVGHTRTRAPAVVAKTKDGRIECLPVLEEPAPGRDGMVQEPPANASRGHVPVAGPLHQSGGSLWIGGDTSPLESGESEVGTGVRVSSVAGPLVQRRRARLILDDTGTA